jgi:hypothetical protein
MLVMHFIICVLVFYLLQLCTSMHRLFYSVMYVRQFCSGVIIHITELVYVFLYTYLLYAPVYPMPMHCLSMFSYVHYFQFFSVLIMQKSDGLRLFI